MKHGEKNQIQIVLAKTMKSALKFIMLLTLLLTFVGCASSGGTRNASPITAKKPFDLDVIFVKTSSALADLEAEKLMLNDRIISDLREAHLFKEVSGNKADISSGSGITISAEIKEIREVSKDKRSWAGALAGKAQIRVQVLITDINSGNQIETFEAEGQSSGGSNLAGTTEEAIGRAADEVVGQVLKINSETAERL